MSNNVNDFLDQMGEKEEYERSSIGIVREIEIEAGWHGFVKGCGHDFWKYWRPFKIGNNEEMKAAFFSSKDALRLDGLEKSPAKSFKITIYPDSENKNETRDLYAAWMHDAFAMVSKSIRENELPIDEKFWGRISFVPNPNAIAQGESGKTEEYEGEKVYPNIRVPVQKFANEQQAIDFVEANSNTDNDNTDNSISKSARDNAEEILSNWAQTKAGILPKTMEMFKDTYPVMPEEITLAEKVEYQNEVKKWLAELWEIPAVDIDKLEAQETLF